eukprot:2913320-Pleurochrysis_carterae.AAC.1
MRLEVLWRYLLAWQALISSYHAPAFYCRALPLLLQRAGAATTGARQASTVRLVSSAICTLQACGGYLPRTSLTGLT